MHQEQNLSRLIVATLVVHSVVAIPVYDWSQFRQQRAPWLLRRGHKTFSSKAKSKALPVKDNLTKFMTSLGNSVLSPTSIDRPTNVL